MDFSQCSEETKNKKITVSEAGKKFIIKNKQEKKVIKIKVDGSLINDHRERCDWIFEIIESSENMNLAIYLELKGKDIQKAYN